MGERRIWGDRKRETGIQRARGETVERQCAPYSYGRGEVLVPPDHQILGVGQTPEPGEKRKHHAAIFGEALNQDLAVGHEQHGGGGGRRRVANHCFPRVELSRVRACMYSVLRRSSTQRAAASAATSYHQQKPAVVEGRQDD